MRNIDLAYLIVEHERFCRKVYVPGEMPGKSFKEGLEYQESMCNSLVHFSGWLRTMKGIK